MWLLPKRRTFFSLLLLLILCAVPVDLFLLTSVGIYGPKSLVLQINPRKSTETFHGSNLIMNLKQDKRIKKQKGDKYLPRFVVGLGTYNGQDAAFLGERSSIRSVKEEVLPVPIIDGSLSLLKAALQYQKLPKSRIMALSKSLVNRDDSLYDNLPWEEWGATSMAKKTAFDKFMGAPTLSNEYFSPYDLIREVINSECNSNIEAAIIERDDALPYGFFLGGALKLVEKESYMTLLGEKVKRPFSGGQEKVVVCSCDEALGMALSLNAPVSVEEEVWEAASVRAEFDLSPSEGLRLSISLRGEVDTTRAGRARLSQVRQAWDIPSPGAFYAMEDRDMRECLLASGVTRLPRSREGKGKLEEMLLPMMDEAVRRAVLLQRALERGDYETAVELSGNKSERQVVIEQLAVAKGQNNMELAERLQERLNVLKEIRADYTQDEGSYQRDLDQDEWYWRNRQI